MEDSISYEDRKRLVEKAKGLQINVRVGKLGITPELISEIDRHLKKDGLVKVRMLRNYMEERNRFQLAETIAVRTGSLLLDVKGFVALFCRKKQGNCQRNV